MGIQPEAAASLLRDFADHEKWCRHSLLIRDKSGERVPLALSPSQIKLSRAIAAQERAGKPVRVVALKARQVHMSVGACSHLFKRIAFLPGQHGVAIGESHKSASNIWGYVDQFQKSYSSAACRVEQLGLTKRREPTESTAGYLEWCDGSWLLSASADNARLGRSFSLRHVLCSEAAYYRDPQALMASLMNCVPEELGTSVIVESTANGRNWFHDLCMRARNPMAAAGWAFVFFGWWEHPEYTRELDEDPERFRGSLDEDEQWLVEKFRLTLEQLHWRRWAIAAKCDGSKGTFQQEYPATPEEAFQASKRARFDQAVVLRMPVQDGMAGELERVRIGTREEVHFLSAARGAVKVWRRPVVGRQYVIGADAAEGIDAGDGRSSSDPDWAVAHVLDRSTGEQTAMLRVRLEPSAFGKYLVDLAAWYNMAFVVPEANGPGLAVIEEIVRQGWPGALLYRRDRLAADQRSPMLQDLGWKTTSVSRPQLLSVLDRALMGMAITVYDQVTVSELQTFVYRPNGRPEADTGCHDDCVIALALGVVGLDAAPAAPPLLRRQAETVSMGRYGGRPGYGMREQAGEPAWPGARRTEGARRQAGVWNS